MAGAGSVVIRFTGAAGAVVSVVSDSPGPSLAWSITSVLPVPSPVDVPPSPLGWPARLRRKPTTMTAITLSGLTTQASTSIRRPDASSSRLTRTGGRGGGGGDGAGAGAPG